MKNQNEIKMCESLINLDPIKDFAKIMELLDRGSMRIAEQIDNNWKVNENAKMAILQYMKNKQSVVFGDDSCNFFDKVPLKTFDWQCEDFERAKFRIVPGAIVRYSAYIAQNCVIMPSFINVGAYIDERTMIDSYATVGSCAQIGKSCHIASGVIIGGVLEPVNASPVIVEDDVFIGANSSITEGVVIKKGAVIGSGVNLTKSTKIFNKSTGEIVYGYIPEYSVVVPGVVFNDCNRDNSINNYCERFALNSAIIVATVSEETRKKVSINELLRS